MKKLQIQDVNVSEIKPNQFNPRQWSKKQFADLKESIRKFDLVSPIVVNSAKGRENVIIGGEFRLEVVKKLKHKTIPVVYLDIPDLEKEKELVLRLNKNIGSWDYDMLKDFDLDFLQDVGFEKNELEDFWLNNKSLDEDEFDVESELEKIKEPQTKVGEVIELGRHRLICGDSTDRKVVEKLMQSERIDMICNDPIFNLGYDYQKGLGKKNKYKCEFINDKRTLEEYKAFLAKTLENALEFTKEDAHVFIWNDQNNVGLLQELYREHGIKNKRTCLWIKNNSSPTPQVAFNKCYEVCCYGTRGKPYLNDKEHNFTEILNPEIGTGNQCFEDIAELFDIWFVKRLPTNEYLHATHKPIKLYERPLKRCTKIGDNVLDMFGGSGPTLLACEQLGRTAYVIEKSPVFCDLIRKRFEKFKQNKFS